MPTPNASPPSEMVLMERPNLSISTKVPMMEMGIDSAIMSVFRRLPKKSRIIKAARIAPSPALRSTFRIELFMNKDWSRMMLTRMSAGSSLRMSLSSSLTSSLIATVLPPLFSRIDMLTTGLPFRRLIVWRSLFSSDTLAISRTQTGAPFLLDTMRFSISFRFSNLPSVRTK